MNEIIKPRRRTLSQTWRDLRVYAEQHLADQEFAANHYGEKLTVWNRLCCWLAGAATGLYNDNRWMPIAWRLFGRTSKWDAYWESLCSEKATAPRPD